MAIYECEECGGWKDDDHDPCDEHPETGGLICGDCQSDLPDIEESGQTIPCAAFEAFMAKIEQ